MIRKRKKPHGIDPGDAYFLLSLAEVVLKKSRDNKEKRLSMIF